MKANGRKMSKFVTAEDGKVEVHPKSVNSTDSYFESPLLLYHTKLKTSSIFLHDTTMVYPFPVVLFAKNFKITGEKTDHVTFQLNPLINFTCSFRTASFVKVKIIIMFICNNCAILVYYVKCKLLKY